MTAQEAITKLTNIMHDDHYAWHPSILTAFNMAVDALRGLPSAQPTHGNTSNALKSLDCIDRQAAIDALDKTCINVCQYSKEQRAVMCGACPLGSAFDVIDQLPSAQPDKDLIHLQKEQSYLQGYEDGRKSRKGKWIEDAETFYKAVNKKDDGVDADTPYFTEDDIACSECLSLFSVIDNCTECFDYCPSCGADMREGEADE